MDNRPIGVFDSGVGGLTTVRELHKVLPGEDILYFGDTGRVPYGTRGRDIIRKYAAQDIRYLMGKDVKAIIAACGTVSANFSEQDARDMGVTLPYLTIVQPATRKACAMTAGGRVGVIATPATIRSGAYGKAVRAISPWVKVFGRACQLLVPLVEAGMIERDNPITRMALQMYLKPLLEEEIDTLILGCTHYPLLYDMIGELLDYKVTLIDAGAAAVGEIQAAMVQSGMLAEEGRKGVTRYRVTDDVERFAEVARHFLDEDVTAQTEQVDMELLEG